MLENKYKFGVSQFLNHLKSPERREPKKSRVGRLRLVLSGVFLGLTACTTQFPDQSYDQALSTVVPTIMAAAEKELQQNQTQLDSVDSTSSPNQIATPENPQSMEIKVATIEVIENLPFYQRFSYLLVVNFKNPGEVEKTTNGTGLLMEMYPSLTASGDIDVQDGFVRFFVKIATAGHVVDGMTDGNISLIKPELGNMPGSILTIETSSIKETYTNSGPGRDYGDHLSDHAIIEGYVSIPVSNGQVLVPPVYGSTMGSLRDVSEGSLLWSYGYPRLVNGTGTGIPYTLVTTRIWGEVNVVVTPLTDAASGSPVFNDDQLVVGFLTNGDVTPVESNGNDYLGFIAPAEYVTALDSSISTEK